MEPIPQFPVLYKQKATGKISQWSVCIFPSEQDESKIIETTFGEMDGAQQIHRTVISAGKAKRTILQQAVLEAKSKWSEKKNKEGYQEVIQAHNSVIRPMLANTFQKELYVKNSRAYKIPFPMYVQRKYDGIRCMAHKTDRIILESRKGTSFSNLHHIEEELYNLFDVMDENAKYYFDGELYTNTLPFETINGLVRLSEITKKSKDFEKTMRQIQTLEYHIYDLYDTSRVHLTFHERNNILNELRTRLGHLKYIKFVDTELVKSIPEMKQKHDLYVMEGYEGIMLRDKDGLYESNKRSKYLQKYKEFMEEEFEIVGYHDGEGIDKGLVIWECINKNGIQFSAKPRGSHEYRRQLYSEADKYIGHQLTIIFQEYSIDGVPRFPVGKAIRDSTM